jgi:hypothetical protein
MNKNIFLRYIHKNVSIVRYIYIHVCVYILVYVCKYTCICI